MRCVWPGKARTGTTKATSSSTSTPPTGGATTLYNPYTTTVTDTVIYLPGNVPEVNTSTWPEFEAIRQTYLVTPLLNVTMQADYLLWIKDAASATLLSWDGAAWITRHAPAFGHLPAERQADRHLPALRRAGHHPTGHHRR